MSSSRSDCGVVLGGRQLLGQAEQAVGLAAHRRRHDDHLVAGARPLGDALGDVADALGRAHRGAAVLVNDQCHESESSSDRACAGCARKPRILAAGRRHGRFRPAACRPAASAGRAWAAPPAAWARASMPRPGTNSSCAVGIDQRAVALPGRHARRLELLLQAARRTAGPRWKLLAAAARAQLAAAQPVAAPTRRGRRARTSKAPPQAGTAIAPCPAQVDAQRASAWRGVVRAGCGRSASWPAMQPQFAAGPGPARPRRRAGSSLQQALHQRLRARRHRLCAAARRAAALARRAADKRQPGRHVEPAIAARSACAGRCAASSRRQRPPPARARALAARLRRRLREAARPAPARPHAAGGCARSARSALLASST